MEFFIADGFTEDPDLLYWRGTKLSLEEKMGEFTGAAEIFKEDYVRPIECDELQEVVDDVRKIYTEIISTTKTNDFSGPAGGTKPLGLLAQVYSGEQKSEELSQKLRGLRSYSSRKTAEKDILLKEVRRKIEDYRGIYKRVDQELDEVIGRF